MGEIQTTHDLVKEILKTSPKARNSDNYLLYAVYATIGRRHNIDIDHMSVPTFFLNMKKIWISFPGDCQTYKAENTGSTPGAGRN